MSGLAMGIVTCGSGAFTSGTSSGGGLGFGLGPIDWTGVLAFMAGAVVIALLSAGVTLIAARRVAPVPAPIPTWGEVLPD
jgi:hypothetical protein